ncbi:MAG: peptidoglycan DD-metalloendopeptidase family protein [Micavibrio sp.]
MIRLMRSARESVVLAVVAAVLLTSCGRDGGPAPVFRYDQKSGAGSTGIHTIAAGESVGELAERYNLVLRDILVVNRLEPPYRLAVGQRLKLPAPRTYKVRSGDTVSTVSRLFNTSASQMVRLNNLNAPYVLQQGQILKLPVVEDLPKMETISISPVAPTDGDAISRPISMSSGGIEREELAPPEVTGTSVLAPAPQVAQASLAAKVPTQTPPRSGAKFMKPVEGPILSGYGAKPGGLHNDGINIKAPKGAPVRAAENGVVVYAGSMKGYGNMVLIRHADRWMTAYAHLDKILIERGATLTKGAAIGTVGSTGTADEPQLHFEVRRGTSALNPEKYM